MNSPYRLILCVFCLSALISGFTYAEDTNDILSLAVKGEYQKAITLSIQILTKNERHLQARLILGNLYLETGEYQKAESTLEYFNSLTPSAISSARGGSASGGQLMADELLLLSQGLWLYALRKGDKEITKKVVQDYLPRVEKMTPQNPYLYVFWGNCYLEKGDIQEAKRCFGDALKKRPGLPEALLGLAKVTLLLPSHSAEGEPPAVISLTDFASISTTAISNPSYISLTSPLAEVYNLQASVNLARDFFIVALNYINKALEINPNSVTYRATRASIYYLNNNRKEFEKECQDILSINPSPALFYLIIADNLERRLLYTEATAYYEKAIWMDEHLWDAQISAGFNFLHLGPDYEKRGKKLLNDAFERDPFNVRAYNMLKVLDALEDEFEVVKTAHFEIKLHKSERFLLEPYITELLEDCFAKFAELYQFTPQLPILVEVFPNHNDFSVRLMGFPGFLAARGVCFARTFLVLSPKAQEQMVIRFHWGSITVHEFMHVITLQMSKFRVPRWFTEGCSVYAEKLYNLIWAEELEDKLIKAIEDNKLKPLSTFIDQRGADILHSYLLSSLIIEYIHKKYGMDKIIKMLNAWGELKNSEKVFKECLDKSIAEFDSEFIDYLKNVVFKDINLMHFEAVFRNAKELLKRNKTDEAISEFIRAKGLFPDYTKPNDSPYHYLIAIYEERNQPDKAFEEIEQLIKKNHLDFPNRLKLARRYRSEKQYEKLVSLLKETVYLEPESIQVHNYLAEGERALRQYENALREYEIAIKLTGRLAESQKRNIALADFYCSLCEIYLELNNKPKAKEHLVLAEDFYPAHKKIGELLKRCEPR
ncbi:MAG: tetratricopeptide repeat protein [Planctomycetota bacterium]|nr:tetratricopeptide repeat protein [Planctomycetota bacterium]MDI6788221.1 tetratricopeptide repeat protein [Planctomycetota bacterium]